SAVHLPTPPSAARSIVASRGVEAAEGAITAEWTAPQQTRLTLKNTAAFSLKECWAVSKDTAWPVGEIPAASSRTLELQDPHSFEKWAAQQLNVRRDKERSWWWRESMWDFVSPSRCGLVLSFYSAIDDAWSEKRTRHQ